MRVMMGQSKYDDTSELGKAIIKGLEEINAFFRGKPIGGRLNVFGGLTKEEVNKKYNINEAQAASIEYVFHDQPDGVTETHNAREKLGLTQEEFAGAVGVSLSTVRS